MSKSKVHKFHDAIKKPIINALATGKWEIVPNTGANHHKLRHIPTGRIVIVGASPSCHHVTANIARDIKHVEAGMPAWGKSREIEVNIDLGHKKKDNKHKGARV